jgi:hypothetical protein
VISGNCEGQVASPNEEVNDYVNLTTRLGAQPWQVKVQMFVQKLQWHVLSAKSATTSLAKIVVMILIVWNSRSSVHAVSLHNFTAKLDN